MGFLVAFLIEIRKNVIVPISWVHNLSAQHEKFMNYGLNCNQKFLCFYTDNLEAFNDDGSPRHDYVPDFDLEMKNSIDGDGCYIAKLRIFKSKVISYFSN